MKRREPTKRADDDLHDLAAKAIEESGVAEAVEIYERVEAIYGSLSAMEEPSEYAANSTSDIG